LAASLLYLLALAMPQANAASAGGTSAAPSGGSTPAGSSVPLKGATGGASTRNPVVRISRASCVPAPRCTNDPHQVSIRGTLMLQGAGLKAGMVVVFPRALGARISRSSPGNRLRQSKLGLVVSVPSSAHSGRIMVLIDRARHTGSFGPIHVYRHALHPPGPKKVPTAASGGASPVSGTGFDGQGMWIWYMSQSNGGSVPSIVARARAAGVTTLFIKSSDGSHNYWTQFSSQLVQELHANGLKACAWQYVYGSSPAGEAELGARAVANGADCLVIDAEAEYEGHYAAAQTYINTLRTKIGPSFPLGLASFPYVSFHSALPYSVFLGPGGAQYNAPQMYWHDIGVSVDTVYANTYIGNRIYGRPIFPLGQTYGGVSASDVLRFRQEARLYGAGGISFWDWQETPSSGWSALAAPLTPLSNVTPNGEYPELRSGRKGDQVLWLQEHLASAIPAQEITGTFGSQTAADLRSFQSSHGIPASGIADPATWKALLALPSVAVNWTGGGPKG
jgi:peptidoglycan hydrolase-like protein with peptidoglycan-binding domain